tara:strand:- start:317 stop:634 length:318 start_codon:yes stop_codon:yes gene_type:complete
MIKSIFWIIILLILPLLIYKGYTYQDSGLIIISVLIGFCKVLNLTSNTWRQKKSYNMYIWLIALLIVAPYLIKAGVNCEDPLLILFGITMICVKLLNISGCVVIS